MTYKLTIHTLNEIGLRRNQEDCLFPAHGRASSEDRLFILCDGSGDESGAAASRAVCQALSRTLMMHSTPEGVFSDAILQQAITSAYNALDDIADTVGEGVGTTLAVLKLHEGGATIAYVGSSRIYHVRPAGRRGPAQILFRSADSAEGEPRMMMPHQKVRVRVEVAHIQDILPDDVFFLCSDGMLEFFDDDKVLYNLTKPGCNAKDKINIFSQATVDNKDNHSAMLIHITRVRGRMSVPSVQPQGDGFVEQLKAAYINFEETLQQYRGMKLNRKGYTTLSVFCAILLALIAWIVWPSDQGGSDDDGVEVAPGDSIGNAGGDLENEEVSIADFGIDDSNDDSLSIDDFGGASFGSVGPATNTARPAASVAKKPTATTQPQPSSSPKPESVASGTENGGASSAPAAHNAPVAKEEPAESKPAELATPEIPSVPGSPGNKNN